MYIHPRANASRAIEHITDNIHKLDSISPDAPKFILGDFNHCSLNKTLKTYHQYVTCPTRFNKTIDSCFGTVPGAYTSLALPPLGSADHNSVLLVPVYKPVIQRVQPVMKTVKDWTEDSVACLQGCFDCTDLEMFDQMCTSFNELTDVICFNEPTDVISSYISFCVESVIPSKHITIFPNNKPWVTKDLKGVLNKKKRVFFQSTTDEKTSEQGSWGGGGLERQKRNIGRRLSRSSAVAVFVLLGKALRTWQPSTRCLLLVGQGLVWRGCLMRHCQTT